MNDFPRWKYALVVVVLLLGILYGVPNLFVQQPAVQVSANRGATVDQALKERVQGVLEKDKIAFQSIDVDNDHLLVRLPVGASDDQNKALEAMKADLGEQYVVAPNLASTVPAWMRAIGAREMPKGLDLQGGVHFLMEVDDKDVLDKQVQRYTDDIRGVLRDKNIRYQSVGRGPQGVVVQLRTAEDRDAATALIQSKIPDLVVSNGTTTADSFALNASVKPDKVREAALNTIRQNQATLSNRINALGVAEPLIQQQGESRIVVELPGVQDTAEAKRVLGAQATLEYHAVDQDANAYDAMRNGSVPPDDKLYYMRNLGPDGRKIPILLKKKVIVSGDEMVDASSQPDPQSGTPGVSVHLNATGGRKMLEFTTQNVGKPMAVLYIERTPEVKIIDGKEVRSTKITEDVISSAVIRGVFSSQFSTTGLSSSKEASDLALLLRSGSLAAPIDIVEERVIGPSLGADNIKKGVFAVLLGLGAVLIFMAFYYWLFGLIANVALFFNLVLLLAIMSAIGVTLTMPGIAGIVLTLGMAIDANVLICERIREELRNGSTPLAAIRAGYDKAWATILDANVTHLLAALALMTLGSGAIRGFGVTLFIGILTSMFTSVTVTHAITNLIHSGRKKLKGLSLGSGYSNRAAGLRNIAMELFNPNSNIDFLAGRKVSIAISVVLVLASLVLLATRGLNYALDFTGGVIVEATYQQPVEVDQVRAALEAAGIHNAQVQSVGGTRDVSIRLQPQEGQKDVEAVGKSVMDALQKSRPDASLKRHPDFVGSSVGAELKSSGIVAAVFVMIGIMIYIGIRFEKRFAVAAIASEIHDTILTLGFFSLTQMEFDLTVLAALLAVIGYSINDKVVVFDRVRELFRMTRKADSYDILNKAINQTLSRTIMTSLTTSLTMFALYFVGGPAVHGFGLTMLVGIVIGTLSSIFFANPILYWLGVSKTDLMPVSKENPELARRP